MPRQNETHDGHDFQQTHRTGKRCSASFACLTAWTFALLSVTATGCWSEPEAADPIPLPVEDPQIVERPVASIYVGDFAAVRTFRFIYEATVSGLPEGEVVKLWVPLAVDGPFQRVKREKTELPGDPVEKTDPLGNKLLYTEATAGADGKFNLKVEYLVERVEVLPGGGEVAESSPETKPIKQEAIRAAYDKLLAEAGRTAHSNATDLTYPGKLLDQIGSPEGQWRLQYGFVVGKDSAGTTDQSTIWLEYLHSGRWQPVDVLGAVRNPRLANYAFDTLSPHRIHFSTGDPKIREPLNIAMNATWLLLPRVEVKGNEYSIATTYRYEDAEPAMP